MIPAIIPAYRDPEKLARCVNALEAQTVPVEVFVRDNSIDNIQFTAAVNQGFRKYLDSPCEYMMTVNQDMYLEPAAVERMVEFMNANPRCGIAAPLQISATDPKEVVSAGGTQILPLGHFFCGPLKSFKKMGNTPIHWASGCCWLVRKAMMREIGLLDENLVFIGSDADYCFTARARGWYAFMIPAARGVHECGKAWQGASELQPLIRADAAYLAAKWAQGEVYDWLKFNGSMRADVVDKARMFHEQRRKGLSEGQDGMVA